MNILRIPTSYITQLEYLSEKDFNYVLKTVFELSNGKNIKVEKSMRGGLVISIFREAIQMENKARAKKGKKRLTLDVATLMGDSVNPIECDQVKENNIKENKERHIEGDDEYSNKLNEYFELREEITEKIITDGKKSQLLRELFSLAKTKKERIKIIQQSINKGWLGFFEIKKGFKEKEKVDPFKDLPRNTATETNFVI